MPGATVICRALSGNGPAAVPSIAAVAAGAWLVRGSR